MRCLLAAALLALAPAAWGANLVVQVKDSEGRPVKDAVATLKPAGAPLPPGPIHFPWPMAMSQHDTQFDPFVLVVPQGAEVPFPNRDRVRHHVYSFSPVKSFQLKLYSRDETRVVTFERVGVVPLGCNIHDRMIGFIDVVDTPWAGKTDAAGDVTLQAVPAGRAQLTIWHPYMKSPRNQVTLDVTVASTGVGRQAVTVALGPAPARDHHGAL